MSGTAPMTGQSFPRAVLFFVGSIMAMVTLVAMLGRMGGTTTEIPASTAVAAREFRFGDRLDGGITVSDAADGHVVTIVTGQAGFMRATLRGLAQQRIRESLDDTLAFRLTRWADGRLTLDDLATHRHIELEAFGETNEAVFARLFTATPQTVWKDPQ